EQQVDSETLVPGDLLILGPGTLVPADARLLQSEYFSVDESILTGESLPVYKSLGRLKDANLPLADRVNMVYKGCIVTTGRAVAIVVGTGDNTEVGHIQKLIAESTQPQTPMQRQLTRLGNQAAFLSIGVSTLILIIGMLRRTSFLINVRTAI